MKKIISLIIAFLISFSSYSASYTQKKRPMVIRTKNGTFYIPQNNEKEELKGQGITFRSYAKSSGKTVSGKLVTTFSAWVRNCGDVDLPTGEDGKDTKGIKNGDMVELKFDRAGSCTVIDWKKF